MNLSPAVARPHRHQSRRRTMALLALSAIGTLAACGDGETDDGAAATTPAPTTTAAASSPLPTTGAPAAPATTPVTEAPAEPATSPPTTAESIEPADAGLAAQIEAVLTEAIAPDSMQWNANGVNVPPTAAVAAVRVPGRDDVLVAVGENIDGTLTEAEAPFAVASLTGSLVRTLAFQMVDEGVLDPTLTVDHWVPTLPNSDRVTVQMVIDNETGWSDYGPIEPDPVITDFARAWTLREVVELRAPAMTALGEPGTRTDASENNETVLGMVVEDVAGRPLAELVRDRVSRPAGLDDTELLDGSTHPEGYRHGAFAFDGQPTDSSGFDGTSYLTWNQATHSVASTPTDLLDLLDVWTTGELFITDRTPAPDRYAPDPAGNPNTRAGLGVPFNGYCPCADVEGGTEPDAIGRKPLSLGTTSFLLRYGDGVSVVVNLNSGEVADSAALEAIVEEIHQLAAATR